MKDVLNSTLIVEENKIDINVDESITLLYDEKLLSIFTIPKHTQTLIEVYKFKNEINMITQLLFIEKNYYILTDPLLFDGILFKYYNKSILTISKNKY